MIKKPNRLPAVLILFFVLSIFACFKSEPKIAYLREDAVILAFGDSLTFGMGAERPENAYPAVLQGLINRKVINAGISGEVTAKGLERLQGLLDEYKPSLLILCHGANDLLRKLGEEEAADNIRAMIRMAKERGVDVVLLGVPRLSITSMSAAGFYKDIAEEFNILYDNNVLFDIVSNASLKSDYVHPNIKGYRMMADAVAALLVEGGAVDHINVSK